MSSSRAATGGTCRRLLIRWERFLLVYRAFFAVVLLLLCVRLRDGPFA